MFADLATPFTPATRRGAGDGPVQAYLASHSAPEPAQAAEQKLPPVGERDAVEDKSPEDPSGEPAAMLPSPEESRLATLMSMMREMQSVASAAENRHASELRDLRQGMEHSQHTLENVLERAHRSDEARTATGCELWIAERQLAADLLESVVWYNRDGSPESQVQTSWRLAYWSKLRTTLPNEIFARVQDYDVRDVYMRIIMFNAAPAIEQIEAINKLLADLVKGDKSMIDFLEVIYSNAEKLEVLDEPALENTIKNIIRRSLRLEDRYKLLLTELDRNPAWDLAKWRAVIEGAATKEQDLVTTSSSAPPAYPKSPAKVRKHRQRPPDPSSTDEPDAETCLLHTSDAAD